MDYTDRADNRTPSTSYHVRLYGGLDLLELDSDSCNSTRMKQDARWSHMVSNAALPPPLSALF